MRYVPKPVWLNRVGYELIISVVLGSVDNRLSAASRFGFSVDSARLTQPRLSPKSRQDEKSASEIPTFTEKYGQGLSDIVQYPAKLSIFGGPGIDFSFC